MPSPPRQVFIGRRSDGQTGGSEWGVSRGCILGNRKHEDVQDQEEAPIQAHLGVILFAISPLIRYGPLCYARCMRNEWVILAYNDGASVPFAAFNADWASRDGVGRVEFFKNRQLVDIITLEPSQTLLAAPIDAPPSHRGL
jgi:hypothetical protein